MFGDIVKDEMILNGFGEIVESVWCDLSNHYKHVELDQYVIMPNHLHAIVKLEKSNGKNQTTGLNGFDDSFVETHGRMSLQMNQPATQSNFIRLPKSISSFCILRYGK